MREFFEKIFIPLFCIGTFLSVILLPNKEATLAVFCIGMIGILKDKRMGTVLSWIIVGFLGAFAESIAVHYGIWTYKNPDFLGVPYYLPFVWANASIAIVALRERCGY